MYFTKYLTEISNKLSLSRLNVSYYYDGYHLCTIIYLQLI